MNIFDLFFPSLFAMDLFLPCLVAALIVFILDAFAWQRPPKQPNRRRPRQYCLIQRCRSRRHRWIKDFIESFQTQSVPEELHLFVRGNKTMALSVSKSETVLQLKRKVASKIGVNFQFIKLTYGTKFLMDNFRLGEYLPDQATLHLSLRLLGGNGNEKVKVRTLIV